VVRAPRRVAALYTRNCVQGPRAELAQELGRANRDWMSVATNYGGASSTPQTAGNALASGDPSKRVAQDSGRKKKHSPGTYRVRAGDSLIAIAKDHSCEVSQLAKANRLRAPGYMIKPGQKLKLTGCSD
jgi:membrane-bound lytic murein transglycosylase D